MSGQGPGRQGAGAGRGSGQEPAPVSPLMIQLLVVGLAIGFFSGYFLLWWGALVVLGVIVAAVSLVLRGRSRDGATGAVAGVLLGYAGVILLALFRGAL